MSPFFRFLSRSCWPQIIAILICWNVKAVEFGLPRLATIMVLNTTDSGAGSLRQALSDANNGDTIAFDATLSGQTITLTSGELLINKSINIVGPGSNLLAVSRVNPGPPFFRILHIAAGNLVTIEGLTISGGYASGEVGGGVATESDTTVTIANCTVFQNASDGGAGGGGIWNGGTLTIINSIVSDNWAGFTFGFPIGYGGGIYNAGATLTIIHGTIANNTAVFNGGGIIAGTAVITDCTIRDNRAGGNFEGSGLGGGVIAGDHTVITNSTINGNVAQGNGSGEGGGILSSGALTITNSTISDNSAGESGGGVSNAGMLAISNSTVSGNSSGAGSGILNNGSSAMVDIENTILNAGASGANILNNGGTVTSHGYNLSSDSGSGSLTAPGDLINTKPMLGPLQDNGGPTLTHVPLPGSPAIDAGDPNFTPPPLADQRGYDRMFNGRIDIGSVEVQPTPTPTVSPTPSASPTPSSTSTPQSPTPTPSATPTATPTPTPSTTPSLTATQLLNISTRLHVQTGDGVMIGGFIVTGKSCKQVGIRGIGPSLSSSGISDALADPVLQLRDSSGILLSQNDNWDDDQEQAAQLIQLGLGLSNSNESGLVATLQPNASYTAILAGNNGGTGVGLVEIYDTNPTGESRLANISTRGLVQTGDNVMIGGFILGEGSDITSVALRGIGPSLTSVGLNNVLPDPTLELRDANGVILVANDNWQDDAASAAQLAAHGLTPQNPLESGIFTSLSPGAFTAILAGNNSGVGIGLVEIYDVQ